MKHVGVGLDVDGVICDLSTAIFRTLGLDPELNRTWHWGDSYGVDVERQVREYYRRPDTWVNGLVMPEAREAIDLLVSHGLNPVFLTAMPGKYKLLREWWLREHFGDLLAYIDLYTAPGDQKAAMALSLELTHFVEDRAETANALAEAGLFSALIPTNYNADAPTHPRVERMGLLQYARQCVEDSL